MQQSVSKSQFKSQVLQYLRAVEQKKVPLVVTHGGKPVVKVLPYQEDPQAVIKSLRGSVIHFEAPNEPIGENEWEAAK